jgi:hypothetical protein
LSRPIVSVEARRKRDAALLADSGILFEPI